MIKTFARYLLDKRSELADLEAKDALLAKVVLDIHRKRSRKEVVRVPLFALVQVHALDRDNVIAATTARVDALRAVADPLRDVRVLDHEVLAAHLPSVSWIKTVEESPERFIAFEGNGRIAALQTVFTPEDRMDIDVEVYRFPKPASIVRRLRRVQRMNGLLDP